MKRVLFSATVDSHILAFHLPYLKWFKDQGYEVHVVTNGTQNIAYCDVKHVVCFERNPFKLNNIKAIHQLRKIIKQNKFDIIHTHTPMGSVITRIAARKAKKKEGTKVIYTAHGFHFYKGAPFYYWAMFYPVEKYLSKYTSTLITINKEDYALAQKKFKKTTVKYIPGIGIDSEKFNVDLEKLQKEKLRDELGLKENEKMLLYIAELNKNKNQEFLIKCMQKLVQQDNRIHLFFAGRDSYNGYYQEMTKKLGLTNNIHFLGFRKDIPKLLKITDISVSASKREGLPVNIMEALINNVPIIALNCRGMKDLLENNENGHIVKEDVSEFTDKVFEVLSSNNTKNDVSKYLLPKILKQYTDIYQEKIKIMHLLKSNRYSGAENVACTIIKGMNDYNSYYVSPEGQIKEALNEKKIQFNLFKSFTRRNVKKAIKEIKPDIIHAHDIGASVIASKVFKGPIISHIHGNHYAMRRRTLKSVLYHLASKKFKRIIWVSNSCLDQYYKKNKVIEKSNVIPNVLDVNQLYGKIKEDNKTYHFDLVFIGRMNEAKNPERLIEIMALLKDYKKDISLAMIGDGELEKDVLALIDQYNLKGNIHYFGRLNNPYKILKCSSLFIMTSRHEGTPMAALEAISCGVPIISTKTDGLVELIKDDKTGYLCDTNEEFVEQITRLLSDKDKLKKLQKNSISLSEKINDLDKYLEKIEKEYKRESWL